MKLKNIIALLLSLIMCVVLVGCGSDDDGVPDGMKVLEQASASYTIYVPESWQIDSTNGFASAYAAADDPSNVSFMAYKVPSDEKLSDGTKVDDADTFWKSYEEGLKSQFPDIEFETYGEKKDENGKSNVINYTNTKLGGLEARKYIFYITFDGEDYEYMMVVALNVDEVFLLTYNATRENYDKHLDEVEKIIKCFKFN